MPMKVAHKKVFATPRSKSGRAARPWSFSLYPQHVQVIRARESELNLHPSVLLQLLIELEAKHPRLREELRQRLSGGGN